MSQDTLTSRIAAVQERIAAAARRAGRDPAEVTLVAVSKTHTAEEVAAAYAAGLRVFGENRVEEAAPKVAAITALLDRRSSVVSGPSSIVEWHMIGHLQSRKAEDVLPWASMVHSVDSIKLAQRLSRSVTSPPPLSYQERGNSPLPLQGEPVLSASKEGWGVGDLPILLEVNVSGEASKYGFQPEELPAAVETIATLPRLAMQGLMTMAPIAADPEDVRPVLHCAAHAARRPGPALPRARLAPPLDGDDRRFRGGDRGGGDDRANWESHFRRKTSYCVTMNVTCKEDTLDASRITHHASRITKAGITCSKTPHSPSSAPASWVRP